MPDIELKIKADVAETERKIAQVKQSIEELGKQEKKLAENPLNPSASQRMTDLGVRPGAAAVVQPGAATPASNPTVINNPARLEFFRQSIDGYKQITIEAEKAALKANLLNAAAGALPPELQAALALTQGISAQTTILGASVLSLGGILAAGLVTILAVKKATDDILKNAKERLAAEEAITAEWQKQAVARIEFQKRLKSEAGDRQFSNFLEDAGIGELQATIDRISREREQERSRVEARQKQLAGIASASGLRGDEAIQKFTNQDNPAGFDERQKAADEQISQLTARIAELRRARDLAERDFVQGTGERTAKAYQQQLENEAKVQDEINRAAEKAAKEREAERKRMVEESIRKAKEWAAYVANARQTSIDVFTQTSDNRFLKIFTDTESAIDRIEKATGRWSRGLQQALSGMLANRAAAQAYGQDLDNRLRAMDLRDRARDFDRGFRRGDEDRIRREALRQIFPNYSSQEAREQAIQVQMNAIRAREAREQQNDLSRRLALLAGGTREDDQRIIALTQNVDPSQLRGNEQTRVRDALLREAGKLEDERKEGLALTRQLSELLKADGSGIKVRLADDSYHLVEVVDKADLADVGRVAAPSDTKSRSNRR